MRVCVRVINHRGWKREGRAKMAVDVASNCRNCETRCIPDWPIRPWPSQGSSASSASFLPSFLQEASPSCGELSKPRSFPSPSSPPSPIARARSAIARIEQPQPTPFSHRSFHGLRAGGVGNSGEGWRCDFIGGRLRASRFREISRRDARSLASPPPFVEKGRFGFRKEGGIHRVLATSVKRNSSGGGERRNYWNCSRGYFAMAKLITQILFIKKFRR